MGELGFCHPDHIVSAVRDQITTSIAADSGWPFFLIRLLHNKIESYLFFFFKCYFQYLDTEIIFSYISSFLLPFILYAIFGKLYRKRIIFLTLIFPIIFIFPLKPLEIGTKIYIFQGFYIFLAILGFVKLILEKILSKS